MIEIHMRTIDSETLPAIFPQRPRGEAIDIVSVKTAAVEQNTADSVPCAKTCFFRTYATTHLGARSCNQERDVLKCSCLL